MFVDNGHDATELSQCPYRPGTDEWKSWQHQFMNQQGCERDDHNYFRRRNRATEAYERADARIAAVKEQTVYTEKNEWHDKVMAEIEPVPPPESDVYWGAYNLGSSSRRPISDSLPAITATRGRITFLDAQGQPIGGDAGVRDITATVSGAGWTRDVSPTSLDWHTNNQFTFFQESFSGLINWDSSGRLWTSDPIASPRQHRRTRGQTIEERRLMQALSGKPITVRPGAQNHQWKKKR